MIFLIYAAWYGLGRMLIEGIRTDSLMLGDLRISQVLGGVCLVGGIVLIILFAGKAKIKALENDESYKGVYGAAIAKVTEKQENPEDTEDTEEK